MRTASLNALQSSCRGSAGGLLAGDGGEAVGKPVAGLVGVEHGHSANARRSAHSGLREIVSASGWKRAIALRFGSGSAANGSGAASSTLRIAAEPNTSSASFAATRIHSGPLP